MLSTLDKMIGMLYTTMAGQGLNTLMRLKLFEIYKPDDLKAYADNYVDNADSGENVNLYDWIYTPDMSLSIMVTKPDIHGKVHSKEEWISWFDAENNNAQEEMNTRYWDYLLDEEIQDPIVITMENQRGNSWDIWDGWHRCGASITTNRWNVPAVIGYYKKEG